MRQIDNKRRRRSPNLSEKFASILLMLTDGTGKPLIPDRLRKASAKEIIAHFDSTHEWDHARRHAQGGDTSPHNISPRTIEAHRKKTNKFDIPEIAKSKRIEKKTAAHREAMLMKGAGTDEKEPARQKRKRKIPSAPFPKRVK